MFAFLRMGGIKAVKNQHVCDKAYKSPGRPTPPTGGLSFYYFILTMSENCLFCKIIKGEIPSKKIYEDDEVFAFYDIAPQAPVHFLVVPKRHISTIMDMQPADCELVGKMLYRAQIIAKELGIEESGARFVFNCKADAGQTVFHIHLHVLGGQVMGWPPFPAK